MLQGAQTARAAQNISVKVDPLGVDVLYAHRDEFDTLWYIEKEVEF